MGRDSRRRAKVCAHVDLAQKELEAPSKRRHWHTMMITYREKIARAHRRQLDERLDGEDGGEKVVAVGQERDEKR